MTTIAADNARARRTAKRIGLKATRRRDRFRLIEFNGNVVAGDPVGLSAAEVVEFCIEYKARQQRAEG